MKDTRDPIDVYHQLMEEKTAWNCSILEAADRVELQRVESSSLTSPVTKNGTGPTWESPPETPGTERRTA